MHVEDQGNEKEKSSIKYEEGENNDVWQWEQDTVTILIPESVELADLLGMQHENMLKF